MRFIRLAALAAVILIFELLAGIASAQAPGPREELTIAGKSGPHEFQVELADDDRERAMGLMFRRSMGAEEGMLFDFGSEQPANFWMRNTYIPLDLLFIRADGTIESIAERTTPLSEKSVPSKGPVRYVLEINGGTSDKLGIEPGDKVSSPTMQAN